MIPRILAVVGRQEPKTGVQDKVLEVFADLPLHRLYTHSLPGPDACSQEQEKSTSTDALVYDNKPYALWQQKYKQALLTGMHADAVACKANRKAFEEHLRTRDFTAHSSAFMHAELARFLHSMHVGDCIATFGKQCPRHVQELLKQIPMLAQALFVLCEQACALYVFDIFVSSVLEHMVLIEDVIASGGVVPNALAQRRARYVEDWTRAVALLCSRCAR